MLMHTGDAEEHGQALMLGFEAETLSNQQGKRLLALLSVTQPSARLHQLTPLGVSCLELLPGMAGLQSRSLQLQMLSVLRI